MKNFYLFIFLFFVFTGAKAQVNLSQGLAAYYPFTGNANDISGNNNNPSFNNATLTADRFGNPNSAYHFDGVDNYMQIPNSPSLNFGTSMSICVWVRVTGFYTGTCYNDMLVGKLIADYQTGNYSLRFSDYDNGCLAAASTTDETFSAEPDGVHNSVIVQPNQWYSVVSTSDGTTSKVYVNCQLVSSTPITATTYSNTNDLFLGRLDDPTFPYWLNGDLDEVRLYNRAINQDEVNAYGGCATTCTQTSSMIDTTICQGQNFNGHTTTGTYLDTLTNVQGCDSLRTLNLTVNNCAPISCNSWLNTPTVNDYVTVGDLNVVGNQLTVEATFNRTVPPSTPGSYGFLVSKHTNATDNNYSLFPNGCALTTVDNGEVFALQNCPVELNKTYHVAMVYDGVNLKFYRDGYLISQTPATGNLINNSLITTIAQNPQAPIFPFLGYMNEVRIWNVARSQSDIRTYMNSSLPNPTTQTGLLGYYTFNSLVNQQGNAAFNGTIHGAALVNQPNPNCTFVLDSCCSPTSSTIDTAICQGQSYLGYSTTGVYIDTLTNAKGCDSIRTINLTVNNCAPSPCAPVDSVIINTGYDPVHNMAIPIGQRDSNWIVTAMSTAMQSDPLNVCTPAPKPAMVIFNNDIVNNPPAPANSQFISCLSDRVETTTVPLDYTMTVERKFTLSAADIININMNISVDNLLDQISIDGVPQALNNLPFGTYSFVNYNFTVPLTVGSHTISITARNQTVTPANYPNGFVFSNGFDLIVVGTVKSATGSNSIVNTYCTCTTPTFATVDTTICQGQFYKGFATTGTYLDTIPNTAGCDSIITIHLIVNNACTVSPSCAPTDTLIINTGYNARTHTATIPGSEDPNWIVTAMSSDMQNAYSYNNETTGIPSAPPSSGSQPPVSIGQNAMVVPGYTGMPSGLTYISCFPDNLLYTVQPVVTNFTNCTTTIERPFIVDGTTSLPVKFNFSISCDDAISSVIIDAGTPEAIILLNTVTGSISSPVVINTTQTLSPGTHTIDIQCNNEESASGGNYYTINGSPYQWNPFSVGIVGNIVSAANILHNQCCTKSFSTVDTSICQGQSLRSHITTGSFIDTIPNAAGCDSIITLNLTVIQKSFSTIDTSFCQGQSFHGHTTTGTFIDTIPNVAGCDSIMTLNLTIKPRSFSTITTSICQGQTYLGYTSTGIYIDTLVAANGCDSIRTLQLTVNLPSSSTIDTSICQGQNYLGHTSTGSYTDIMPNAAGCDSTITSNITVNPVPTVITNNDTSFCIGSSMQINTTGATTYSWSPTTGLTFPNNSSDPVAKPAGSIQYVVTGTTNGCAANDTLTITVNPLPVVTVSTNALICKNTSTQLSAGGGNSYQWTPAVTLNNAAIATPIASPVTNTIYHVLVTDLNNCVNTDSVKVAIRPDPVFSVMPDTTVCSYTPVQLRASGGDIYLWQPSTALNNAAISDPVATLTTSTTYTVYIKENTCGNFTNLTTTLTALPGVIVTAGKSNDLDCYTSSATLSATGADEYLWSPATALNNVNVADPIAKPFSTQQYVVKGTDANGCFGFDSVTVFGNYTDRLVYNMANAFSPNNDGINDCYGIKYFGVISDFTFMIFNRWGQQMFSTSDPAACWDGTFQGQNVAIGTYVYYIRAVTACGITEKKGTVVLIR